MIAGTADFHRKLHASMTIRLRCSAKNLRANYTVLSNSYNQKILLAGNQDKLAATLSYKATDLMKNAVVAL
jgi:hypothetical protein